MSVQSKQANKTRQHNVQVHARGVLGALDEARGDRGVRDGHGAVHAQPELGGLLVRDVLHDLAAGVVPAAHVHFHAAALVAAVEVADRELGAHAVGEGRAVGQVHGLGERVADLLAVAVTREPHLLVPAHVAVLHEPFAGGLHGHPLEAGVVERPRGRLALDRVQHGAVDEVLAVDSTDAAEVLGAVGVAAADDLVQRALDHARAEVPVVVLARGLAAPEGREPAALLERLPLALLLVARVELVAVVRVHGLAQQPVAPLLERLGLLGAQLHAREEVGGQREERAAGHCAGFAAVLDLRDADGRRVPGSSCLTRSGKLRLT